MKKNHFLAFTLFIFPSCQPRDFNSEAMSSLKNLKLHPLESEFMKQPLVNDIQKIVSLGQNPLRMNWISQTLLAGGGETLGIFGEFRVG